MSGHSVVSQHFIELQGSIPNSQQLSTCTYPEPDQSNSHIHIPSLGSFIQRIRPGSNLFYHFRNKFIVYGEGLLAPRPIIYWTATPCRLSAAAYSICSQITSLAGGSVTNLLTFRKCRLHPSSVSKVSSWANQREA
jgi:hypothetical protein